MGASLLFAACGASTSSSAPATGTPAASDIPSSPTASEPAADLTPNPDISGEITVWGWADAVKEFETEDAGFTTLPAFNELYPNITVKYEAQDAIRNALELAAAAGSGAPDVTLAGAGFIGSLVERGFFADITDQVQPYTSQMPDWSWDAATLDGRIYGFLKNYNPVAMLFSKDLFDQAGVDPASLDTWDDYLAAARTIKEKTGAYMVAYADDNLVNENGGLFVNLLWQQGVQFTDTDGKVILDTDPRILKALEYIGTLRAEDLAVNVGDEADAWYKLAAEGKVATSIAPAWYVGLMRDLVGDAQKGKWRAQLMPAWEPGGGRGSNVGSALMAIPEMSTNKEAAWAWIEYHMARVEPKVYEYIHIGEFPGLLTALEDPAFSAPDPYFGDQAIGEVYAESARQILPPGPYTSDYNAMLDLLQPEIQRYLAGQVSAQEALTSAANQIRTQLERP